ncbi:hypothetical protein [Yersinia enterocolitica]|uniref:hypothetical protein n=1 Tax=Yersinia enterocolitica TaxID=630 RepID=UPI001F5AA060|nr:hypothetical protein [Yersinia enterocolitica]
MRMTKRKKSILDLFKPTNAEWVKREVGAPPLDISGMAYLLYGVESFDKRHQIESIRRTLEAMVKDGQLDKITSYEQRQDTTQSSSGRGVWCNVSRYSLPGKYAVTHDTNGKQDSIDGECVLVESPNFSGSK